MNENNYEERKDIQEQLRNLGWEIDSLAQSTMAKEIIFMFAHEGKFEECKQIISMFRAKINQSDLIHICRVYNILLESGEMINENEKV